MNNELTESENALNCILENYVNELQRNTCDDDKEDMRIYQEKMDYITSLKEIILKDLKRLEQIDNANPSEALKCLKNNSELFDKIAKENPTTYKNETFAEAFLFKTNTIEIEQALLKAQEQDKILKILRNHLKIVDDGKVEFYDLINKTNVEKQSILIESMDTGASIHIHLNDDEKEIEEWLNGKKY